MAGFSHDIFCYFAQESLFRACIRHVTPPLRHKSSRRERHSTFDRCVGQVELARHYFKIIYIGYFSGVAHRRVRKPSTDSVNPLSSSLFILFLEDRLRTRIVYKFSCASCNACYIGEASRHFSTRVHEHIPSDRSSHVYKHLQSSWSLVLPRVA